MRGPRCRAMVRVNWREPLPVRACANLDGVMSYTWAGEAARVILINLCGSCARTLKLKGAPLPGEATR